MSKVNLFINGYGRIGRLLHRILLDDKRFNIVGINSRSNTESHALLLKYDSTYGILDAKVSSGKNFLKVNGHKIKVHVDKDPGEIDFKKENVDVVAECTGKFRDKEPCQKQLDAGAKKVVISAPGKSEDISIVMGVNHQNYHPKQHHIISNASCTTNCLASVIKVLKEEFGVEHAHMTTIHAVTRLQNIVDASHRKCPRRTRSLLSSMIPTTTGAAKAIGKIFPDLDGKINAICIRVPFTTVSLIDLVVQLNKKVSPEKINAAFEKAAKTNLKNILSISYEPLVSIDYKGESNSAVVDALSTELVGGKLAKVLAWYDNEWGYTQRLADLLGLVSNRL
jgi:glyceraldehyde 3-phosphate dehydrogenase